MKKIMIIATPYLDKLAVSGDLLLTSLFGLQESHSLSSFIQQLDKIELAGIVLKNNDYLQKVPPSLINKCKKLELPLINVKSEIQYRETMSHFYQFQSKNTGLTESGLLQSLLVPT
ncbi:PucR family transcriptional regulator ligand-binding domain-containing protein [Liquorilactobacillus aquaticus]|uniref:PucR family transcriptional regulator ligand-binding domain-containing protein n=1 Tax=Liquorilactobacillus aquaticus TaxID=392566 RepID=UPI0022873244|nr:PucR family transcriptional regulator ligand-binding domain-containing protein [Liquorilactobacillus aquaticus]